MDIDDQFSLFDQENSTRGKIIACASAKNGAGKSTISYLTTSMLREATQAAKNRGLRENAMEVVLVDLELAIGQLGELTGYNEPNISTLNPAGPITAEEVRKALVFDQATGIYLLLPPLHSSDLKLLTPEFYEEVIDILAEMFDAVILNTSEGYRDIDFARMAYKKADKILVVSTVKAGSIYSLTRWVDYATAPENSNGYGVKVDDIKVVLNHIDEDESELTGGVEGTSGGAEVITAMPSSPLLLNAITQKQLGRLLRNNIDISYPSFLIVNKLLAGEVFANPLTS